MKIEKVTKFAKDLSLILLLNDFFKIINFEIKTVFELFNFDFIFFLSFLTTFVYKKIIFFKNI